MLRHLWALCKKEDIFWVKSLHATVSSIIHNGTWRWPRMRLPIVREIVASTDPNLIPYVDREDTVTWTLFENGSFSVRSAWQALRTNGPEVFWFNMVWHRWHIPRWSFIQ
ncbi:hypothetical protein RHMOL_Rhmol11G0156500 [Rhododendron molle]|uniref:Uncharacterized protein n=1 Tax=Rhododendron molle TaxID=49168 RepID=A0ACC0LUA9_RHOML|nr:hypothetical protein RHMOL_Rhmol11G0156500 [Rhododendron molle]